MPVQILVQFCVHTKVQIALGVAQAVVQIALVRVQKCKLHLEWCHPGKRGLLGASEWPTFFPRSFENGHTSPRPLKSLPRGPESLSGALRGLWEGVSETPNY